MPLLAGLALARPASARTTDEGYPCASLDTPRPTRVLLIGDSNFFGWLGSRVVLGLEARGYQVFLRAKPASGLACPEFFDWFREAKRVIDDTHPDVVVAMIGANDVQRITWPRLKRRIRFKDLEGWRVAYEARVRAFMQLLAADGREVFYLSPTNRGWDLARNAVERVRQVQSRVSADLPRVHWVDMFPLSSDKNGDWLHFGVDDLGKRISYRMADRIHLTKWGGDLVGARLLRLLADHGV
ncbi:MAG: DUF459 domain-containing protein [Myxococcota bacterium]